VILHRPINEDAAIKLHTWNDKEGKSTMWHSSAHLMASAIEALYPGTKFGIGPDVENGFYYDIDLGNNTISSNDFATIEKKMMELATRKNVFRKKRSS
jgi:threonyl-tRNA synthetase